MFKQAIDYAIQDQERDRAFELEADSVSEWHCDRPTSILPPHQPHTPESDKDQVTIAS